MFGPKMLMGAVLGGTLVYFLDPQNGEQRRQRLLAWWEQNREPVMHTAQTTVSEAQVKMGEVQAKVGEMGEKVGEKANEKVTELRSKVRS